MLLRFGVDLLWFHGFSVFNGFHWISGFDGFCIDLGGCSLDFRFSVDVLWVFAGSSLDVPWIFGVRWIFIGF